MEMVGKSKFLVMEQMVDQSTQILPETLGVIIVAVAHTTHKICAHQKNIDN